MVEHGLLQHIAEIGLAIKRNWYWLVAIIPVMFWSIRWSVRAWLHGGFMSRAEIIQRIDKAEETFASKLDDHEEREFRRQDKMEEANKLAHNSLEEKIDHLTDVIIENLRNK